MVLQKKYGEDIKRGAEYRVEHNISQHRKLYVNLNLQSIRAKMLDREKPNYLH